MRSFTSLKSEIKSLNQLSKLEMNIKATAGLFALEWFGDEAKLSSTYQQFPQLMWAAALVSFSCTCPLRIN